MKKHEYCARCPINTANLSVKRIFPVDILNAIRTYNLQSTLAAATLLRTAACRAVGVDTSSTRRSIRGSLHSVDHFVLN